MDNRMLYNYEEARAELGGIGRTTLFDLMDVGVIKRVKIGRRGFVTAESLAEFVAGLSQGEAA